MRTEKPGYVGCRLRSIAKILRESLPDATYPTPVIHADGSVHYTPLVDKKPPPNINGYVRAKDNPWSFIPLWPECTTRRVTMRQSVADGVFNIVMTCNNPECARYQKNVSCYQCTMCKQREDFTVIDTSPIPAANPSYRPFIVEKDGSILYTKESDDWEPPRDIDGYTRDPENPWRFKPIIWPDCIGRHTKYFQRKNCGCLGSTITCQNEKSEHYEKKVTVDICEQCTSRVPMQIYEISENPPESA